MKLQLRCASACAAVVARARYDRRKGAVKWNGGKAVMVRDAGFVNILSLVDDNTGVLHFLCVYEDDDAVVVRAEMEGWQYVVVNVE